MVKIRIYIKIEIGIITRNCDICTANFYKNIKNKNIGTI